MHRPISSRIGSSSRWHPPEQTSADRCDLPSDTALRDPRPSASLGLAKAGFFALLLCSSLAALTAAPREPRYPATARAFEKLVFQRVAQKKLPKGVYFWTSQGAESNDDPDFEGRVCYLDLNGDGVDEILVESGGKRHDHYELWQKRKGHWVSLLTLWGRPDFLAKRNGYYQVTAWWEYRDEGTRELYSYKGARYHVRRLDRYQGTVFVRALDPREREAVLESSFKAQFEK